MRGNPEIAHDRRSVLTRLRETAEAAKLAKACEWHLNPGCGQPGVNRVDAPDGSFYVCDAAFEAYVLATLEVQALEAAKP